MVRITYNKQKRIKKRIFNDTIAWMNGEKTICAVARDAKTGYHTAEKWLKVFAAEIEKQRAEIVPKVVNMIENKREQKGITWLKKLKLLIVKQVLSRKASSTS